jgi:hypothetical protein
MKTSEHEGVEIAVAGSAHPEQADQADEALVAVWLPARGGRIEGPGVILSGRLCEAVQLGWGGSSAANSNLPASATTSSRGRMSAVSVL